MKLSDEQIIGCTILQRYDGIKFEILIANQKEGIDRTKKVPLAAKKSSISTVKISFEVGVVHKLRGPFFDLF